jgi:hypothetical protein
MRPPGNQEPLGPRRHRLNATVPTTPHTVNVVTPELLVVVKIDPTDADS